MNRKARRGRDSRPEPQKEEGGAGGGRLRWILLAAVVFASGVAVAGAFNPAPHNGGDNAGYVTLAYSIVANGTYTDLYDPAQLPHTKYPPVFPALLALLVLAGARTWGTLKGVSVVSTLVATAFTFLWAERRLGALRAACVAVVVAFASAVVYYSHWILSDPAFLALTMASLWAFDRAAEEGAHARWLPLGVLLAGLAYFTRSAGLPLLVAFGAWLALRRRWRAVAVSGIAVAIPAGLWWLRAHRLGPTSYGSEFWMVDPYQPALGKVGLAGLVTRMAHNLAGYVGTHLPTGIVGVVSRPAMIVLGLALVGLGLAGWAMRLRRKLGVAELFLPLYAGLILLWPEVWSGDRFALPLVPVLLVLAVEALWEGGRRFGGAVPGVVGTVMLLVVLLPELGDWLGSVRQASACASLTRADGAFACYGPRFTRFVDAATWSGPNLPAGSVVLSRKPRIFFVMSGLRSRAFPFDRDPASHLATADTLGARYVLMDEVDGLAARYVGGAIQRYPGAYCSVQAFGEGTGVGTRLFGILPVGERAGSGGDPEASSVRIQICPPSYLRAGVTMGAYRSSPASTRIPLLDGLVP